MLYAIMIQLLKWLRGLMLDIKEWLSVYKDRPRCQIEQAAKDLHSLHSVYYDLPVWLL